MSKVQVDTIDTRSGTSTMQIGSTNTSTINIGVSGDTVNIPSGVTIANAGTATGFGESNTPAFFVQLSGDQTISSGSWTKVTCQTEHKDTDNAYDNSSNYRFTPQKAGLYVFHIGTGIEAVSSGQNIEMTVYKNGSNGYFGLTKLLSQASTGATNMQTTSVQVANGSSDYFEFYFYHNSGSDKSLQANRTFFAGYYITT